MQKVIVIDTDGVLRNFHSKLQKVYHKYYPDFKNPLTITSYCLRDWFPIGDKIYDFIYKEHPKEIFLNALPYPGAQEFVKTLQQKYKVVIATSQPQESARKYTQLWYEKFKFDADDFIYIDEKWKIGGWILIEDSPHQMELAAEHKSFSNIIPFLQVWNRQWFLEKRQSLTTLKNPKEYKTFLSILTPQDNYRIILNYLGLGKPLKITLKE